MRFPLISLAAVALLLAGCSTSAKPTAATRAKPAPTKPQLAPAPQPASTLRGPYWHLTALAKNQPLPPGPPPFLRFATETPRLSGNTGVNSLGGTFRDDGISLTFSNVFTTKMAAADPERNALEHDFLAALEGKNILYLLTGNTLRLGDLTFTAHDAAPTQ